jgi:hypothetical protein
MNMRKSLLFGLAAVALGSAVRQQVSADPPPYYTPSKCDPEFYVACPSAGICQGTNHCDIDQPHRCSTPNDTYAYCTTSVPGDYCFTAGLGCLFERYEIQMYPYLPCGTATMQFEAPKCYRECGSKFPD